jgi:hypothetical protein
MSGISDDADTRLILELLQDNAFVSTQTFLKHIKKATFHRKINSMVDREKIVGKEKRPGDRHVYYYLIEKRSLMPTQTKPSELDRFLIEECKNVVSDVMSSGLLRLTESESEISFEKKTGNWPLIKCDDRRNRNQKHILFDYLDENRRREQERSLLLRRCYSLHHSIRWLIQRRGSSLKGWWELGKGENSHHDFLEHPWKTPNPGNPAAQLQLWLEYYLNVIDILTQSKSEEIKKSPGRKKGS